MKQNNMKKFFALCLSGLLLTQPVLAETIPVVDQTPDVSVAIYETTIRFHSNTYSDKTATQEVSSDSEELLLENPFSVPTGHTFTGWNTKADGSGTHYNADSFASDCATAETNGTTFELYAQWSLHPTTIQNINANNKVDYTVTIQKTDGADGYELQYDTDETFAHAKTLTLEKSKTAFTLSSLTPATTYYVRVRCFTETKTSLKSDWSSTKTISVTSLSAPSLKSAKLQKIGNIKLSYSASKNADGYQLQYSTKKNFSSGKTCNISKSQTTYTLVDLPLGKTYYLHIRSYVKGQSKTLYSAWSNTKTVKIAKLAAPKIKKATTTYTDAVISFSKVKTAQKYELQYSTKKNFKGAKKLTIAKKKTSVKLSDLTPNKTYYTRIRSYCKGTKKAYYSSWSKPKTVKTKNGSTIHNTSSTAAIEADVKLTGSGSGYHAKFVICTATSAVSFGIQYDACAVAPYTGKSMALIENVASNNAGGQTYTRPGNVELQRGKTYHLMLTIDANGNGGVYVDYKKIGSFSNPSLAHQTLYVRVEGSARKNGDSVNASFSNICVKNGGSYDPKRTWGCYEFKTNPGIHNKHDASGKNITFSGSIVGLGPTQDWDNAYGSVSDIIQFT
ncbi:MAG: fibronectin type III domain-containing protein [Lachnospiraceae bacterium]